MVVFHLLTLECRGQGDYYNKNADFKRFVDANATAYNKSVEYMLQTPTAKEYMKYIKDKEKDRIEDAHKDV